MKKFLTIALITISLQTLVSANETIKDVSADEVGYKAMNNAVKKGYLSLYTNNTFKPNQTLTRKELAIALDEMSTDFKQSNLSLTQADIQELNNLSKSFKGNFTGLNEQISELIKTQSVHSQEIETLHHDLSKTDDQLREEIEELKKQRLYTWIGIGLSVLLGVAR